jgi:hypothetical protein
MFAIFMAFGFGASAFCGGAGKGTSNTAVCSPKEISSMGLKKGFTEGGRSLSMLRAVTTLGRAIATV